MTLDLTQAQAALADLQAQHVALQAASQDQIADLQGEVAELSRQLTDAFAQIAWFNARPKPRVHLVASGDTLTSIAAAYTTPLAPITIENLVDWNDLGNANEIHVDDVLYLVDGFDEPDPEPPPPPVKTVDFSVDISALGTDANLTEKQKVDNHKALLGVSGLHNVRVFFGSRPLSWTDARIQALNENDSICLSVSNTRTRAEWDNFLAATPERFRRFVDQVEGCYKHECEAEWADGGKTNAWLADYYAGNKMISDAMAASPWATQTKDSLVKIMLWYSQHIDARLKDSLQTFHGGQAFGKFGMDCYHYQVWGNNGRYATPQELFGKIVAFCKSVGRPCRIPEWGGERADGDTTGQGRAKAITDGGAYLKANADVVLSSNWWCAKGSKDAATGLPRDHHLEIGGSNSPEANAFRALLKP